MTLSLRGNLVVTCAVLLAAFAIGCGKASEYPEARKLDPAAATALVLDDSPACVLDGDCANGLGCFQGRCAELPTAAPGTGETIDAAPGLSLVLVPNRMQLIRAGDRKVRLEFSVSGTVPAAGLGFLIERSDEPGAVPVVQYVKGSGSTFALEVPVGKASPDVEGFHRVAVNVVTQAGTARFTFQPEPPQDRTYEGEAVLGTFGQMGLPISFSLVTDPPNVSLATAKAAYLVLPVEQGNLFSGLAPSTNGPTHVTARLVYDDFLRAWVSTFALPYTLDAASPFAWVTSATNGVSRNLRFELEVADDGEVFGKISDRWSGVFEARSAGGILAPSDIVFEGSLSLRPVQGPPALAAVTPPLVYQRPNAGLLPAPVVTACSGATFLPPSESGQNCGSITTTAGFLAASASAQASCALAMSEVALSSGTTGSQITAFLDDSIPDPGNQSFADFMRDCAAQTNGTCVPSSQILCSRQLLARALKSSADGESSSALALLRAYQDTTREAFLGRQFAAFYADAQTRLAWLKATDYPAIVTSTMRNHMKALLDGWKTQVLEAHAAVLVGQFDDAAGAVLGQQLLDPDALSAQRSLLLESSQSWRGAADALALGASRWDTLLTDPVERATQARYVATRSLDLYLVAGLLAELNRQAGVGAFNSVFAGGFRPLLVESARLTLPYDRLIYDRQGEVVVATSLNPLNTNDTLLTARRDAALTEVDRADVAVTQVLAQAQSELLKQAELTGRISSERNALQTELAELCGVPEGCLTPNTTTCQVRSEVGQCGFVLDASGELKEALPDEANASQAGAAILDIHAALLALNRAEEAEIAHANKTQLQAETVSAFATRVNSWNKQRLATVAQIAAQVETLQASKDATIAALGSNLAAQAALRQSRLEGEEAFVNDWGTKHENGVKTDIKRQVEIAKRDAISAQLRAAADATDAYAEAMAKGIPDLVGAAIVSVGWVKKLPLMMSAYFGTTALRAGALTNDYFTYQLRIAMEETTKLREGDLKELELKNDLAGNQMEAAVADLRNRAEQLTTATELEQGVIRELIVQMQAEGEAALAYERDLVELRDRRDALQGALIDMKGMRIEALQAKFAVEQAMKGYIRVVQRAQLLEGRISQVSLQLDNINTIVGSPAVVFAWANRLTRAEERLERAKGALMDWVVALEYYAVRPFFDQRIQILLARNTTQLEAIAAELDRLEDQCGGAVNLQTVELSVRDHLLGLTAPTVNLQTGATLSPQERFRAELAGGRIPVDKRIRYKSDTTVGDLLNRTGILATTFSFDMNDFANLGNVCNAKVASVSLQLVGEGLGDALPTVTVLYDGTSQLRSCQPDIKSIVSLIGEDQTPFAEITQFKAKGRSISPVAGVNGFTATGNENKTLGGLPLVSQYTVLIDPLAGENKKIAWDRLDDIRVKVDYSYQDLFPVGQCQ